MEKKRTRPDSTTATFSSIMLLLLFSRQFSLSLGLSALKYRPERSPQRALSSISLLLCTGSCHLHLYSRRDQCFQATPGAFNRHFSLSTGANTVQQPCDALSKLNLGQTGSQERSLHFWRDLPLVLALVKTMSCSKFLKEPPLSVKINAKRASYFCISHAVI